MSLENERVTFRLTAEGLNADGSQFWVMSNINLNLPYDQFVAIQRLLKDGYLEEMVRWGEIKAGLRLPPTADTPAAP